MAEQTDLHPSREQLSDFALGKLDDEQLTVVARHLSDCAHCRETASGTTDSLLDLLRPDQGESIPPAADLCAALRNHCRYRIIRRLGQGGMGSVYLAEHRMLNQLRAIKVINPALTGNPHAVERFVREMGVLSKLRHPAIVQGLESEEASGLYLLVMEYVEGETLAQLLERQGPLPVGVACEYARQAAVGLQYAHEQGLVHRDIKPANLMLTRDGQVKILDFGLARLASEARTETGLTHEHATLGTPDYSAPEQALDARNADICADIYSLGCTLFCLLAGKPPFGKPSPLAVSVAHLHEPPPSLRDVRPDVPQGLCDLVGSMLAKLPSQRPQTPAEVAERLRQFIGHEAPLAQERLPSREAPQKKAGLAARRGRGVRGAAALFALLVLGAVIVWATVAWLQPHPPAEGPAEVTGEGFIPLFNGKDLTGWRTWDGRTGGWQVSDGVLVSRGSWEVLFSERGDLEDFHLRLEALIEDGGRSGVRFRAPFTPHDPFAYEVGINATNIDGQRTGSLRDFAPVGESAHKPGEWVTLEVIARGEAIVTKVNGRTTVDCRNPAFKKGHLALLGNYGPGSVKFRRVEVKPLPVTRTPFSKGKTDEFVPLFNGKDLTGLGAARGGKGGWTVEDGELIARGHVEPLYTDYGYFEDFHLRLEARINDEGAARVGFRAFRDVYHQGIPQGWYAVLDATGPSEERTGSLFGIIRVDEKLHQAGEWCSLDVIARGDHVLIKVNGKTTVDHQETRFHMGHIVLHQEPAKSEVRFRKIEIKELTPLKDDS